MFLFFLFFQVVRLNFEFENIVSIYFFKTIYCYFIFLVVDLNYHLLVLLDLN